MRIQGSSVLPQLSLLNSKLNFIMRISNKTIEMLVSMINDTTVYRTGKMLVQLFNQLGASDMYGQGFPSRNQYTRDKLDKLNGTSGIDECLKKVFAPVEFIENPPHMDHCINDFNRYLAFDGWKIIIVNNEVSFERVDKSKIEFNREPPKQNNISDIDLFLKQEFSEIDFSSFISDAALEEVLKSRIDELKNCMKYNIPLAAVFHAGGILETILLEIATKHSNDFVSAHAAPKHEDGKVVSLQKWKLATMIDVAKELGYIKEDVHQFCQTLRNFRNYIHPREQLVYRFTPDMHTAKICFHVLKGAVAQIKQRDKRI